MILSVPHPADTKRVRFREVKASDVPFLFSALSNPEVVRYTSIRIKTMEDAQRQWEMYAQAEAAQTGKFWMLETHAGVALGVMGIYYFKAEHRRAELGYWIDQPYWKQGLMREALPPVLAAVSNAGLIHRLEAYVEPPNQASALLLSRFDFQREGFLRDVEINNGTYISLEVWARLFN